ncbi:hypothetical protein [Candidatus Lokiarchaeum ossiferum]|uniref:hypothetical protein n=1 Tax=Candidatus Lokiarchaeum ossiferum TaxID=2951803 RepID=UPI00352CF088
MARKILKEGVGTQEIDENKQYPAEKYIESLNIIEKKMGSLVLKKVGEFMMESAKWPPNVDDLESALKSIDVAYKMNHTPNSSDKIGSYHFKKISDKEFEINCDNPYPCGLDLGIIVGVAEKFNSKAYTRHKEGDCRAKGKKSCVYSIKFS